MTASDIFAALAAEFPRERVSWRAQSMTGDGTKAMALAYIDARDVMDRLDEVVLPENWQDRYEFHGPRTICYLSIRIDGEWITKADGAGDSDVEAEKGAISDALKRAAVKWGIGRYLYSLDAPWVPCESKEGANKKLYWKRWTADPWSFVKGAPRASAAAMKRGLADVTKDLLDCHNGADADRLAKVWKAIMDRDGWSADYRNEVAKLFADRRKTLANGNGRTSDDGTFPGDHPSAVDNMSVG